MSFNTLSALKKAKFEENSPLANTQNAAQIPLLSLPNELVSKIIGFVHTGPNSLNIRTICQKFNSLTTEIALPTLWKDLQENSPPGPIDLCAILRKIPHKGSVRGFRTLNEKIARLFHLKTRTSLYVPVSYCEFEGMQKKVKENIEQHITRGNHLYIQGQMSDAINEYEKGITYTHQDNELKAMLYYRLGIVYHFQNDLARTISAFQNSLSFQQSDPKLRAWSYFFIGVCLASQDHEAAASIAYQNGINTLPNEIDEIQLQEIKILLHCHLGDSLLNQNNETLADLEYHKAAQMRLTLCSNEIERGELEVAFFHYRRGSALAKGDPDLKAEFHYLAGEIFMRQKKPEDALSHYQLGLNEPHFNNALTQKLQKSQALAQQAINSARTSTKNSHLE